MRKDKGLNGDLDRLPMLTWIMFLKFLDDMEHRRAGSAVRHHDVLKVSPISDRGNMIEIAKLFGGPEKLRDAVAELQALLYAA